MILLFMKPSSNSSFVRDTTQEIKQQPIEGVIEIPKISLKRNFNEGNIDKGIVSIYHELYPYQDSSLLVLAGHSGTGLYAYFNYLYKLKIGDSIYIKFDNQKYKYIIEKIYYQKKSGHIEISKQKVKRILILITCTNNKKDLQTIYVANQSSK